MNLTLSSLPHTWILDLDGTIVEHNGYKIYNHDVFLEGAKEFLHSIPTNDMIIFITSRHENQRRETELFLRENNIKFNHLICDAPYGERILVNDKKTTGLQMCHAVSVVRNEKWNIEVDINSFL